MSLGGERREGPGAAWRRPLGRVLDLLVRFGLPGLFTAIAAGLMASHFLVQRVDLHVGEIAPENVYAIREVQNRPLTTLLERQAADRVAPVFVADPKAADQAQIEVGRIYRALFTVRTDHLGTAGFHRLTGLALPGIDVKAILKTPVRRIRSVEADTRAAVQAAMAVGYRNTPQSMAAGRNQVAASVANLNLPDTALRTLAVQAADKAFRPSFVFSPSETAHQRQVASASVAPAYVLPGNIVVVQGTRVTKSQVTLLREMGLIHGRGNTDAALGAMALALAFLGLLAAFGRLMTPRGTRTETLVWVLGLSVVGTTALGLLVAPASGYLVPVATAAILTTILLGPALGIVAGFVTVALCTVALGFDPSIAVPQLVGALAAVAAVAHIRDRRAAPRAMLYAGVAALMAALGFVLLGDTQSGVGLLPWEDLGFVAGSAILSVIISFGSLPLFEQLLRILTSVRLLELSNPNQPLLRRLLMEAPGTYHHSVVVSNLAESAAEAVGGNGLLARVGAFYHDVGKLRRPFFFVDNQFGAPNPHDRLAPSLSSLIIMSHVKDGVAVAREAGLPPGILEFIGRHHGTTRIQYFWQKAMDQAAAEESTPPSEADFRYPGPKPNSKETAIVMLADTCEAAARALPRPTPQRIEARVRALIRQRLDDGQLDEADLTLRDLDTVATTFTQVLSGVFHSRVAYPDNEQGLPAASPAPQRDAERVRPPRPDAVAHASTEPGPGAVPHS